MALTNSQYERYSRQIRLPGFGMPGQEKLDDAKVLVIGAGGLGCAVLQYLTAAGVGTIGIVDDDLVTLSNLQRQVLYGVRDIGHLKAGKAAQVLSQLNTEIFFHVYSERLSTQNALEILAGYDVIIDGTDNFPTRYLINDACVLLKKPLIFGAVSQFEGQLAIFNAGRNDEVPVNYRDLFPVPPKDGEIPNCSEEGVLGVLPGIIGTMQANEAIKLITGIGEPLINRLYTFNALTNQTYELILVPGDRSKQGLPANEDEFKSMDYPAACDVIDDEIKLTPGELAKMIDDKQVIIIDVREEGELPALSVTHKKLPLSTLGTEMLNYKGHTWVFVCQTGKRSLQAVNFFSHKVGLNKKLYSLDGGILAWESFINKQEHDKAHT
jgi:molybdopterin/thiamine biosynthesis adenylyltransferase/rhodanese-related sulfurtransferase